MNLARRLFSVSFIISCGPRILSTNTARGLNNTGMAEKLQGASPVYVPGTSSVAFVTTPDEASAKKLAHSLVSSKLAACVNVIPRITSIYEWEGKINEDNEFLMIIKTRTSVVDDLIKFVKENHPYSVAEVITIPIENGNLPYLDWIDKTVRNKK